MDILKLIFSFLITSKLKKTPCSPQIFWKMSGDALMVPLFLSRAIQP